MRAINISIIFQLSWNTYLLYIILACTSTHEWVNIIKSKQMIKELSNKKIHWVRESVVEKEDKTFWEGGERRRERRFFLYSYIFCLASLFEINLSSIPCSVFDRDNFLCKSITFCMLLARIFALKVLSFETTNVGHIKGGLGKGGIIGYLSRN